MNEDNNNIVRILDDFQKAFERAAVKFYEEIPKQERVSLFEPRTGDFRLPCEGDIFEQEFLPYIKTHNMFDLCEETFGGDQRTIDRNNQNLFLILDTLVGTVNAASGLRCGISIAIGRLTGNPLKIGDIQGVLVGDYRTMKTYRWTQSEGINVDSSKSPDSAFTVNWEKIETPLYEVPDGKSYSDSPEAPDRQRRLIDVFRDMYPTNQRRAIDCTSLGLVEVGDKGLVAYGDVRGVTKCWHTIPAIKFLLETGKIAVFNKDLDRYSNLTEFVTIEQSRAKRVENIGDTVIAININHVKLLEKHRGQLFNSIKTIDPVDTTQEPSFTNPSIFSYAWFQENAIVAFIIAIIIVGTGIYSVIDYLYVGPKNEEITRIKEEKEALEKTNSFLSDQMLKALKQDHPGKDSVLSALVFPLGKDSQSVNAVPAKSLELCRVWFHAGIDYLPIDSQLTVKVIGIPTCLDTLRIHMSQTDRIETTWTLDVSNFHSFLFLYNGKLFVLDVHNIERDSVQIAISEMK